MNEIVEMCYEKSINLLRENLTEFGFRASRFYAAVWGRDGCITSLGAICSGEKDLVQASRLTLETLARYQSETGQVPNYVDIRNPKSPSPTYGVSGATDVSAWFIIAIWEYYRHVGDEEFLEKMRPHVEKALTWLRYQDANNSGLIDMPEGADWMDASIQRTGKVFHANVLYSKASKRANNILEELGRSPMIDAEELTRRLNDFFGLKTKQTGFHCF